MHKFYNTKDNQKLLLATYIIFHCHFERKKIKTSKYAIYNTWLYDLSIFFFSYKTAIENYRTQVEKNKLY